MLGKKQKTVVLDASAVMALIQEEPGWKVVFDHVDGALLSAVNLEEVLSKMSDKGAPPEAMYDAIRGFNITVVDFNVEQAVLGARFRNATRGKNVSLGDRCCLSLAKIRDCPVLTTDKKWSELDLGVEVIQIR